MNHSDTNKKATGPNWPELQAINRKRTWIIVTSILALLVMVMALLQATPSAVVIVAVIILISLKKAAVSYNILGKKKAELMGNKVR